MKPTITTFNRSNLCERWDTIEIVVGAMRAKATRETRRLTDGEREFIQKMEDELDRTVRRLGVIYKNPSLESA